jgi:hypothetical protein
MLRKLCLSLLILVALSCAAYAQTRADGGSDEAGVRKN